MVLGPPGPSPLPARHVKFRCVVSWIARIWRPAARAPNADPAPPRKSLPASQTGWKKPPERHRASLVAPQTVHDRALLFHKSPGQKTPFCPTLVPKAAGKQIHLHPLDKPIPNDTESSSKTFQNQNHTTTKNMCAPASTRGRGRDPRCACIEGRVRGLLRIIERNVF